MATYKKPCMHCKTLIAGDSRFCPTCGSRSPFGYVCPTCRTPISKEQVACPGCGRHLRVICPYCGKPTFVADKCEHCLGTLMVKCQNPRCGEMQFFENHKCTACGKRLRKGR